MKTYTLALLFLLTAYCCRAQRTFVNRDWRQLIGTPDSINYSSSAIDGNANLIVVSNTVMGTNNTDILITKYDEYGTLLWTRTFNGTANQKDYGVAVGIGSQDDIYVTGTAININSSFDIVTMKYDENGNLIWSQVYNGAANSYDVPSCIVIDANEDVYVGGGSTISGITTDFITLKYNASGVFQWSKSYDYASLYDFVTGIEIVSGNVIITGASASTTSNWDYAFVTYNKTSGVQSNVSRTSIPGVGLDQPYSIARDVNGNLFVTGVSDKGFGNKDFQTMKISSPFTVDWVVDYDYDGVEDVGKSIGVDMYGNSYVTGHSYGTGGRSDFVTIKYDPNGSQLWTQRYTAPDGISDAQPTKIFVTNDGDAYVVGYVVDGLDKDYRLIKYDTYGNLEFEEAYDGMATDDTPFDIQIDAKGNIYVVGGSYTAYSSSNTILKYTTYEKTDSVKLDSVGNPDYIEDEIIVKFQPGILDKSFLDNKNLTFAPLQEVVTPKTYTDLLDSLNYFPGEQNIMVLKIFDFMTTKDTISVSRLGDTVKVNDFWNAVSLVFPTNINEVSFVTTLNTWIPAVYYAEPNLLIKFDWLPNDPLITSNHQQPSLHPNVTYPGANINVDPAWDIEVGQPYIKVGISDYPILWAHEDFGNTTFAGSKIVDGKDYGNNIHISNVTDPVGSHGTSVAGIIGGLRNNNLGIAGIAGGDVINNNTGCSLYSLGCGLVTLDVAAMSSACAGLVEGALSTGFGLHLINCSWGRNVTGYGQALNHQPLITNAVKTAWVNDCAIVASRGNDGVNNDPWQYPANLDDRWLLTVGGSGADGQWASFSSYGSSLDVIAPGVKEIVTAPYYTPKPHGIASCNVPSPGYSCFNGTSSAAPHVSGVAALMMSKHFYGVNSYQNLGVEDVEHIIEKYAKDVIDIPLGYGVGYDSKNGWGLLDAGAALAMVNTPQYYVFHYTNPYTSYNHVSSGYMFVQGGPVATGNYYVDKYEFVRNDVIDLSNQGSPWQMIDAWPKFNTTKGSRGNIVEDDHFADYTFTYSNNNQTLNVACTTYAYFIVQDIVGAAINKWYAGNLSSPTFSYSVHYFDPTFTSIKSPTAKSGFSIYPNPASSRITVACDKILKDAKLRILDMQGRVVYSDNIDQSNPLEKSIDVSQLSSGMYFITLTSNDYAATEKFIK